MITSALPLRSSRPDGRRNLAEPLQSPAPLTGQSSSRTTGQRRLMTLRMSCKAAPVLLVTSPMHRGYCGSGFLCAACKQALLFQLGLELLQGQLCCTDSVREHIIDIQLECAIPLIERCTAAHDHTHPLFRTEAQAAAHLSGT